MKISKENVPCYGCKERNARCHSTCERYIAFTKIVQELKEVGKHNSDTRLITERYELDRADKIKRYIRNRRRK